MNIYPAPAKCTPSQSVSQAVNQLIQATCFTFWYFDFESPPPDNLRAPSGFPGPVILVHIILSEFILADLRFPVCVIDTYPYPVLPDPRGVTCVRRCRWLCSDF